jgi:hypothetical protein
MRLSLKALAAAALMVAGLAVTSAEAAPAGAGLVPLNSAVESAPIAQKTHWVRRCHRTRYGSVRCHRVWVKPRHYRPYGHYRPHRGYHRPHRHYRRY